MSRYNPHHDAEPVLAVASVWAAQCLVKDTSVFEPSRDLWTPTLLDELDRRFVQNLDTGTGNFFDKLEAQLGGGSPECKQLMAEALWILMLFQSRVGAETKKENIKRVWAWSGSALGDEVVGLADDQLGGLGSTGTAYNTQRWRELSFLIQITRSFKRNSEAERRRLMVTGEEFSNWLSSQPGAANRQLKHILCHLLFPNEYERISSIRDKRLILQAFSGEAPATVNGWDLAHLDRQLAALRERLEAEHGRSIDFYEDELKSTWRPSSKSWLLSWNPENWGWPTLDSDRYQTSTGGKILQQWRCGSSVPKEGDVVFVSKVGVEPKGIVAKGVIARAPYSGPHHDEERASRGETARFVDVEFSEIRDVARDTYVPLEQLEREAPEQDWTPRSSGIELRTRCARVLTRAWDNLPELSGIVAPAGRPSGIDRAEARNVILYGPPGTGKTYELQARHIPHYRDADGDRFEFVTFHQSYSYEDFVEGIRPEVRDGHISYEVRKGVLRRLANRAAEDPTRRYALFIDEINRGNVAKIFGELITLIEVDKRLDASRPNSGLRVRLPYSNDLFGVPSNLDIFGTMNTADRSISILDTAFRRRFEFSEVMPKPGLVPGVEDGRIPDGLGGELDLRLLLSAINARVTHLLHRDQTIGHSYFMGVRDIAALRRVLAQQIIPQLKEYFYDDWNQIRLILNDGDVDPDFQIVRPLSGLTARLFTGPDAAELNSRQHFEVVPEVEISADSIRNIYETVYASPDA